MNKVFVTGAAGFIGSTMVDELLLRGNEVVGWDNFATGQNKFIESALLNPKFKLVRGDTLDPIAMGKAMEGCDFVFHFAANADVRFGLDHPRVDLEQNTIATFNVLDAMRSSGVSRIAFSSTGSVYGESTVIPTPENAPFPVQTSLYASSKVAGECLIQSFCEGYKFEGYIFRFVSILGERYTHGHIYDFHKSLLANPTRLRILGDGSQRKSYLHVSDCVSAMLHVIEQKTALQNKHRVETYNLGCDHFVQVNDSVKIICKELGVTPEFEYTGGSQGWIGDNPFIFLDTKKIRATGWKPMLNIEESILRTLRWLNCNRWIYEARA